MRLPETWTLIAESWYVGSAEGARSKWIAVKGALMEPEMARHLHDQRLLLMAQKRLPSGRMGLVIKSKSHG